MKLAIPEYHDESSYLVSHAKGIRRKTKIFYVGVVTSVTKLDSCSGEEKISIILS